MPFSWPAVVTKRAVHNLVSKQRLKYRRRDRFNEGGVVDDPPPIGRHDSHGARHGLQSQTQGSKKWMTEQKLRPCAGELPLYACLPNHAASALVAAGIPLSVLYSA